MEKEEQRLRLVERMAIILGVFGLIILIVFWVYIRKSNYTINYPIDLPFTSMVGTFLSGTIGVLFSFVSVILFYSALIYQKKELHVANQSRSDLQEAYCKQNDYFEFQKFQDYFFQFYRFFNDSNVEFRSQISLNGNLASSLQRSSFQGKLFTADAARTIEIRSVVNIPESDIFFAQLDIETVKRLASYSQHFYSIISRTAEMECKSDSNKRDYLYFQDTLISPLSLDELYAITLYAFQKKQHLRLLLVLSTSTVWLNFISSYETQNELNSIWEHTRQWFVQRPEYLSAVDDFKYS